MNLVTFEGLLIPFIGTSLGAMCVLFMKKQINENVERSLLGFASGVMVAASVWSLIIPAIEQSECMGKFAFIPAVVGFCIGMILLMLLDKITSQMESNITNTDKTKSCKKNDNACPGGCASQYSGGYGGWRSVCKPTFRQRQYYSLCSVGFSSRNCYSKLP